MALNKAIFLRNAWRPWSECVGPSPRRWCWLRPTLVWHRAETRRLAPAVAAQFVPTSHLAGVRYFFHVRIFSHAFTRSALQCPAFCRPPMTAALSPVCSLTLTQPPNPEAKSSAPLNLARQSVTLRRSIRNSEHTLLERACWELRRKRIGTDPSFVRTEVCNRSTTPAGIRPWL